MKSLGLIFIFVVSTLSASVSSAVLWTAQNQWDENWESQFADWISGQVKPNFFIVNNISTDCADAVISLRWIFARQNSLPMASRSGSNYITNLSTDWDHIQSGSLWQSDARF